MAEVSVSYKRDLSLVNLIMLNAMGMIGSGWLFAELYASSYAGSLGSIIAWLLGGFIVLMIALTYMEVSSAFPLAGGSTPIGEMTHGKLVGFIAGWGAWISDIMTPPIEAIAMVTYASAFIPGLVNRHGILLTDGYIFAVAIMIIVLLVNLLSVRVFGNAMSILMIWKWLIPLLVIVTLIPLAFHPANLTTYNPFYAGYHGIFYALVLGGIIFSFEGFRAAVNMAGEARRKDYIWKSVIISLLLVIALYTLLQVAFVGAVRWSVIGIKPGDWGAITSTSLTNGPFARIAYDIGFGWLAVILLVDAVISPGGAGISYAAYPARIFQSMANYGYAPKFFSKLDRRGVPSRALILGFFLGLAFIYEFPGWDLLVGILTSTLVIAYVVGPASINILRRTAPDVERPFTLRGSSVIAPVAFIFTFLVIYWSGWPLSGEVVIVTLAGLLMFFFLYLLSGNEKFSRNESYMFLLSMVVPFLFSLILVLYYTYSWPVYVIYIDIVLFIVSIYSYLRLSGKTDIISGSWYVYMLLAAMILSYIGPAAYGGINIIKFPYDFIADGIIALIFYIVAQATGHRTKSLEDYVNTSNE
ncbi:APC family permease [Picrophilus oshimae]|uniref:Amino acid/polyamine/organocation transporter, APC superfamily n=1 Tax=Picrophilus torridus (strain ATCC 700027 / DSM 9790 / JCM 10055 / NBRC 100828 / KAW 2/3) TaxID=1122961 RepID=A0A8G2FVI0_PICTO|nr:APC family permease [Picrophilus oshimae]SMD30261.1 amino acid/polyamine/organocation transporter, APC superfamily [Picrophilus oshimae DSM 9789]